MDWTQIPGFQRVKEAYGETTVIVETERVADAARYCRDELGFDFLSDLVSADYLNWGAKGVAGFIGTASGREIYHPMTQGLQVLPEVKPKRFSVSYHLLALKRGAPRVRLQVWLDEGERVPSVVSVWPTADWHEREQFDMMGVEFDGHPNLKRILMDEDWEGHPLRKDYPIGGEPVRFSDAE